MLPSVYLAGSIKGLSYDASTDWRQYAAAKLRAHGIAARDPMRYTQHLAGTAVLQDSYQDHPLSGDKGVVGRDYFDVQHADVLLAYLRGAEKPSLGTMIEYGWASAHQKPIIAVLTPDDVHWHGMVRALSTFIVPTLDEAIDIAIAILDIGETL